jgi:hypothetical protein
MTNGSNAGLYGQDTEGMQDDMARVLSEVGDGGFSSSEFEVLNQLGRLSWVCVLCPTGDVIPFDLPFKCMNPLCAMLTCCFHGQWCMHADLNALLVSLEALSRSIPTCMGSRHLRCLPQDAPRANLVFHVVGMKAPYPHGLKSIIT